MMLSSTSTSSKGARLADGAICIRRVLTTYELDALFMLRHRVFCEEVRFHPTQPDLRFHDRFDAYPTTIHLVATIGVEIVGGVRFMAPSPAGLPSDPFFDFSPYLPKGARCGNGSMLVVGAAHRRRVGLGHELVVTGCRWAREQGLTHIAGLAAPNAEALFRQLGFRVIAAPVPHPGAGRTATPLLLDLCGD